MYAVIDTVREEIEVFGISKQYLCVFLNPVTMGLQSASLVMALGT